MDACTARIAEVNAQLHEARSTGNVTQEFITESRLQRLLDQYVTYLKSNNRFRPLAELDPDLDQHLTVTPRIKLVHK